MRELAVRVALHHRERHALLLGHVHRVRQLRVVSRNLLAQAGKVFQKRLNLRRMRLLRLAHLPAQELQLVVLLGAARGVSLLARLHRLQLLLGRLQRRLRGVSLELALRLESVQLLRAIRLLTLQRLHLGLNLVLPLLHRRELLLRILSLRRRLLLLAVRLDNLLHVLRGLRDVARQILHPRRPRLHVARLRRRLVQPLLRVRAPLRQELERRRALGVHVNDLRLQLGLLRLRRGELRGGL